MKRLGLLTVRLRGAHVERGPSSYAAITVPVSGPLEFYRDNKSTSVTDVAMRYGFYHLGRFASYYKHAFGELPSETLGPNH